MKNILKLLFVFIVASASLVSCEQLETNFEALTNAPDANASYYVQFKNSAQSFKTSVNDLGQVVEISKTISVALLGMPQATDVVVPIKVDITTTLNPDMYTLSANSVTIPAGKTSGSITVTSISSKMPIDVVKKLVLTIDLGEHSAPNGTKLTYSMMRINFCPIDFAGLVGKWTGKDSWSYPSQVVTSVDAQGNLIINGIGFGWFQDWWGEVIVTNTKLKMTVNKVTGKFTIAEQPYLVSTYLGDPQPAYGLSGSGQIDACKKTITLDYIYHQAGSTFDGSSWGPKFKEVITLQ